MKPTIQSVKGTRDFYPIEMHLRNWLYAKARQVAESFGYQEYDAPFLESIELYAAKSGEELVKEQAFVFPDRSGDLITLRPELTLSLARMIAHRQRQLVYPLRWWSWGPFWRYERPQKGRTREFFQWNVDLIGVSSPEADAEAIAIAVEFLKCIGLKPDQVQIMVNDRMLLKNELLSIGVIEGNLREVYRWIDRRDKMSPETWDCYATEIGLVEDQLISVKLLLNNTELWKKSENLTRVFEALHAFGVSEYTKYSANIIRGLDYYTSTVFEVWDLDGEFRAILGGGRYDNLVADVGGEPLPGVGFAMGDVVLGLVLKKFGHLPVDLGTSPAQVLVTVFDQDSMTQAVGLATELRQAGINVICYPEAIKIARQIKFGDRMGMCLALIVGPQEKMTGVVAVKNLANGNQVEVPRDVVTEKVAALLARCNTS